MKPINTKPKVSIVIPTSNSAQTLEKCLRSVKNQTYNNSEIIVIDDFSNDETVTIAESFEAKIIRQKCNPAQARNLGVECSSGEYVLFLDSDQILSPSVVEESLVKRIKENAEMVRIPEVFVGKEFWSVCSAVWRNCYDEVERLYEKRFSLVRGKPRFFVKKRVVDAGMFDNLLLWGEDYDLHQRLKNMNVKEAQCESVLYHCESFSLKQFFVKNLRYSKSMPIFMQQAKVEVFPNMLNHGLLTFAMILRKPQRPKIIVGCALLFWIKSTSMIIGVLPGLRK